MPFDETYDRTTGIGASEMWDAYNWSDKLYYSKLGDRRGVEYIKAFEGNIRTELGQETEAITRALGAKHNGLTLIEHSELTKTHPEKDWIFATVDGLILDAVTGQKATLEIKLVGFGPHLNWGHPDDGVDALPNKVRAQVTTQMSVEDTQTAYVFAQIGTDIRVYRIARDPEYEAELFSKAETFWGWVVTGEGFPIGPGVATRTYLSRKWNETSKVIKNDPEAAELIREREALKIRAEAVGLEKAQVENLLRERIADNDGIEAEGVGRATFLFDRRGRRTLRVTYTEEVASEQ